ncbi:MAG: aldehyde dehydrogenase (NADP(+)) [Chitinophagales bacterium]
MEKGSSAQEIDHVVKEAWLAYHVFRKLPLERRATFMRTVAAHIELISDDLVRIAMAETNLPDARLRGEKNRTVFQLNSYADACERGEWLEAKIDQAAPLRAIPKPDTRKTLMGLGPVVVFGASNFPFAYSTAGGDTACAWAAGCPVIVKAHPAHRKTSDAVAAAIFKAISICQLPNAIFSHIHGDGFEAGNQLVIHPLVKAVGFTGSFTGGKALFDLANQRKEPIPVFAEMGSINPVFILPDKLKGAEAEIAGLYAGSITLSVGQFCTNPGLVIGVNGPELDKFVECLGQAIKQIAPGSMLHQGIAKNFAEKKELALAQREVETVAVSEIEGKENEGIPTIASASGQAFLNNPVLHQEVFGPYSLVIRCSSSEEMLDIAKKIEGQLTSTLIASETDIRKHEDLVEAIKNICGRLIFNGVPTGVEVSLSMHHGGPFPATTDSRFTSVGADGIKRFARPICFQNWPDHLLPDELQNANPLGIWRTVNNELTKAGI